MSNPSSVNLSKITYAVADLLASQQVSDGNPPDDGNTTLRKIVFIVNDDQSDIPLKDRSIAPVNDAERYIYYVEPTDVSRGRDFSGSVPDSQPSTSSQVNNNSFQTTSLQSAKYADIRSERYQKVIAALDVFESKPQIDTTQFKGNRIQKLKAQKEYINNKFAHLGLGEESFNVLSGLNIDEALDLLGKYYEPDYFVYTLFSILSNLTVEINEHKSLANYLDFCQFFSLIHDIVCRGHLDAFAKILLFRELSKAVHEYFIKFSTACCSHSTVGTLPFFDQEIAVDLMCRLFKDSRAHEKEMYEKMYMSIFDLPHIANQLDMHKLKHGLLIGERFSVADIAEKVKTGWELYMISQANRLSGQKIDPFEMYSLFQVLHSACIRLLLEKPDEIPVLLNCYDYFIKLDFMGTSVRLMRAYMEARYYHKMGNLSKAKALYHQLIDGKEKAPVFDFLIELLTAENNFTEVADVCLSASEYYKVWELYHKAYYYEHKATIASELADEVAQQSAREEADKPNKSEKARRKNHKKHDRNHVKQKTVTKKFVQVQRRDNNQKEVDTTPVYDRTVISRVKNETVSRTKLLKGNFESRRICFVALNDLFDQYHCLPTKSVKSELESCLNSAEFQFKNDVEVMHSVGWGYHVIQNNTRADTVLINAFKKVVNGINDGLGEVLKGDHKPEDILKVVNLLDLKQDSPSARLVAKYLSTLGHVFSDEGHPDASMLYNCATALNTKRLVRKKKEAAPQYQPKISMMPRDDFVKAKTAMA